MRKSTFFLLILTVSFVILSFTDNRLINTRKLESETSIDNNITVEVTNQKQENISYPNISGLTEEKNCEGEENLYDVVAQKFLKGDDIVISYPTISGLSDSSKQQKINNLLKTEAFTEFTDYSQDQGINIEDLTLTIEYEISLQNNNLLSVCYKGYVYLKGAAYPRSLFTTINIDINEGKRIKLGDLVNIDDDLVQKVKEGLYSYIDKDPDWAVVYRQELNNDLLDELVNADYELGADCNSYITNEYLVLSFLTQHVAGDHFEIEYDLGSMKKYMTKKGKFYIFNEKLE